MDTKLSMPIICFNDPELLNEVYVTKNKYYDKDPFMAELSREFVGKSTVFAQSNEEWADKRKIISSAFYKDKLI
jgi:cytochrome P450